MFVAATVLLLLLFLLTRRRSSSSSLDSVPGPRPLPVLGNALMFLGPVEEVIWLGCTVQKMLKKNLLYSCDSCSRRRKSTNNDIVKVWFRLHRQLREKYGPVVKFYMGTQPQVSFTVTQILGW